MSHPLRTLERAPRATLPKVPLRFHVLHVCSTALYILAVLCVVGGVLLGIGLYQASALGRFDTVTMRYTGAAPDAGLLVLGILGGLMAALLCVVFGQVLQVQLAREENQRVTNELLLRLLSR